MCSEAPQSTRNLALRERPHQTVWVSQPYRQVTALPRLCPLMPATPGSEKTWHHSSRSLAAFWVWAVSKRGTMLFSHRAASGLWLACSYLDKRCWNFSSQWHLPRHCPAPQRGRSLLREHMKPFSSSVRAACLSVWIQSKSRRCFGYFLPELEGIIEGYCCHSKELYSWPHFLLLPSNVNRWNLTAWITRRVHFSTRNSLFLLPFSLSTLSPLLGTIFVSSLGSAWATGGSN